MNLLVASTLAATLASGCTEAPQHPSTTQVHESDTGAPIDLGTLPKELPPKVAALAGYIVKVEAYKAKGDVDEESSGTGVIWDDLHVLTAAHVVVDEGGKQLGDCDRTFVSTDTQATGSTETGQPLHGSLDGVATVQAVNNMKQGGTDVAFLTLDAGRPERLAQPGEPLAIRATLPRPGEALFIFGFGPDAQGTKEDPSELVLDSMGIGLNHKYPRIIGAVVTHNVTDNRVIALTGLASYGEVPDTEKRNRLGDSGGAAFTAEGEFVGIVSQGSANLNPNDMNFWTGGATYAHQPPGFQPSSITAIQPVTNAMVKSLPALSNAPCG